MRFTDRSQAGKLLAHGLEIYKEHKGVVLGVPRGGIPVAYEIARQLSWPLEIVMSKKIGHPDNKEYAIGAVGLDDRIIKDEPGIPPGYADDEADRMQSMLREMRIAYMGSREPSSLTGKLVIIADDGIATGNTLLMTIRILRSQNPDRIIVTAPVAAGSAVEKLRREADNVIVAHESDSFTGVGQFYDQFQPTADLEVRRLLDLNLQEVPR